MTISDTYKVNQVDCAVKCIEPKIASKIRNRTYKKFRGSDVLLAVDDKTERMVHPMIPFRPFYHGMDDLIRQHMPEGYQNNNRIPLSLLAKYIL